MQGSRYRMRRCRVGTPKGAPSEKARREIEPIHFEARRGRIYLRMTALFLGRDLAITLSGGDRPHIGAVALAQLGAGTTVLPLPKHREGELAGCIATELASRAGCTACVACGIHLEAIRTEEIQDVLEMAEELTQRLCEQLGGHR